MFCLWFLIAVLSAWRITALISYERGPFAIGVRLRSLFGVYHDGSAPSYDEDGELRLMPVTPWATVDAGLHEIALGMTCVWCCSVWVSLVLTLVLARVSAMVFDLPSYVLVALAMSSGVIVVQTVIDRLKD